MKHATIKGRLAIIGQIEIDGEELTGAFIECSVKELKAGRNLFDEHVVIKIDNQCVIHHIKDRLKDIAMSTKRKGFVK